MPNYHTAHQKEPDFMPIPLAGDRFYPWVSLLAILTLSIGSGITTYLGMLNYAAPLVSLAVTTGVQGLMFVFAFWLSQLLDLRTPKAVVIAGSYFVAAIVSIFFSFAAFGVSATTSFSFAAFLRALE